MRYFPDSDNVLTGEDLERSIENLRASPVPTLQELLERAPALVTPEEIRAMARERAKPMSGAMRAVMEFVENGLWPKKEASE